MSYPSNDALYFINAIRDVLGLAPIFNHGKSARERRLREWDERGANAKRIDVSSYQRFGLPAEDGNRRV